MKSKFTLAAAMLASVSVFAQKNCIIEEFTSSTCPPCASTNAWLDPLLTTNNANKTASGLVVIKYQMNWPANTPLDPSYNTHGATRRTYYGVSGIPDHYTNGGAGTGTSSATMQTEITNCKTGTADVTVAATYIVKKVSATEDSVIVTVTVTPTKTVAGNYTLQVGLTESYYNYPGAYTPQKDYYHVMRKMYPSGSGTALAALTAGTPQTFTFKDKVTIGNPVHPSFNWWVNPYGGHVVAFVQNNADKSILNSIAAQSKWAVSVDDLKNNVGNVTIMPNPATSQAAVFFTLNEKSNIHVNVVDAMGRSVYTENAAYEAGSNRIILSTDAFAAGTYTVSLRSETGVVTERLVIAK